MANHEYILDTNGTVRGNCATNDLNVTSGSSGPNNSGPTHSSPYNTRLQRKIKGSQRVNLPRPSEKQLQLKKKGTANTLKTPNHAATLSRERDRENMPPTNAEKDDTVEYAPFQFSPAGSGTNTPNPALPYLGITSPVSGRFMPETPQITPGESPSVSPHYKGHLSLGSSFAGQKPTFAAVTAGSRTSSPYSTMQPPPITPRGIRSAFRANFAAERQAATEPSNYSLIPPPLYPQQTQPNSILTSKCKPPPSVPTIQVRSQRLPNAPPNKAIGDLFGNISHQAAHPDFDKQRHRRYHQFGSTGRTRWRNDSIP